MAMYIAKCRNSGLYVGKKKRNLTSDINKARIFTRKCDVKNSLNYVRGDVNTFYEIIQCSLNPQTEKGYFRVVYKLTGFIIRANGKHWKPKVFNNRADALLYLEQSTKDCNLHKDYFEIQNIGKKEFEAENGQRPNWQDYFLGLALVISRRSHDIHTQHGCVIVDDTTKHILGTGYNGFPHSMQDGTLPTSRPDKYDWMIHSEVNACNNMLLPATESAVAYVTGEPCTPCLIHLWQRGIKKVIHQNAVGSNYLIDEKTRKNRDILLAQTGMKVYAVESDLAWLAAAVLPNQRCI
jgi:dCMP deaminase